MPQWFDVPMATLQSFFSDLNIPNGEDVAAHRWARANGFVSGWWNGEIGSAASTPHGVYCVTEAEASWADLAGISNRDANWGLDPADPANPDGVLCRFWNGEEAMHGDVHHVGITQIKPGVGQIIAVSFADLGLSYLESPYYELRNRSYRKLAVHRWAKVPHSGIGPFQSGVRLSIHGDASTAYCKVWVF